MLGVSPQGVESHKRFAAKHGLNFPLLVDDETKVARAYGAFKDTRDNYEGIPLKVKRSTFVIDEDGKIEQALYGVRSKGHVDTLKKTLGI